jgi:hypothetical protein
VIVITLRGHSKAEMDRIRVCDEWGRSKPRDKAEMSEGRKEGIGLMRGMQRRKMIRLGKSTRLSTTLNELVEREEWERNHKPPSSPKATGSSAYARLGLVAAEASQCV